MNYELKTARIVRFEQFAQGGKKNLNIFEYFHSVFKYFISVFEYFQTFSNVFERFLQKLARLVLSPVAQTPPFNTECSQRRISQRSYLYLKKCFFLG